MGSAFIATEEANASQAHKQGIVEGSAQDIVYSRYFTGVHGNYLRASILAQGMDPDNLPEDEAKMMNFGASTGAKAWKDIWGAGQGIGAVHDVVPAATLIERLAHGYADAAMRLKTLD
jgi:nitronate monooxygenase